MSRGERPHEQKEHSHERSPRIFTPIPKTPLKGEEALSLGQRPKNETHVRHAPCKGKSLLNHLGNTAFAPAGRILRRYTYSGRCPELRACRPFRPFTNFNFIGYYRLYFYKETTHTETC